MKLNKTLFTALIICLISVCFVTSGCSFFKKKIKFTKIENVQESVRQSTEVDDKLWCITFQLVWNELMENFTNGPVEFVGYTPDLAKKLNEKKYTKDDISENSYYITYGKMTRDLKTQIEKEIYKKFKEKSDILDTLNWAVKDSFLFYSMLKKNFNFLVQFDNLESGYFADNSENKVKFFGISDISDKKLRKNINVLFYKSPEEYAVKLLTKENEEVILYRTENDFDLESTFDYIVANIDYDSFSNKDTLKVPYIDVDKTMVYSELTGKQIVGTEFVISDAIQTIKMKMDNKGGSLKSEAAIVVMKTALMPEPEKIRHFDFDKKFVMFLKEEGKEKPYFAMLVDNNEFLVKE